MVLLYDWDKIFNATGGSPVDICRIFRMLVRNQIPENMYDPIYNYKQMDFSGQDYLLHPELLEANMHKYSHRDIGIYIALASIRKWADWVTSGNAGLDASMSPMSDEMLIFHATANELLSYEDGNLLFLYEEAGGTGIH